jgi:hypothetical protein
MEKEDNRREKIIQGGVYDGHGLERVYGIYP